MRTGIGRGTGIGRSPAGRRIILGSKRFRVLLVLALAALLGTGAALVAVAAPSRTASAPTPYQLTLRGQVDTALGAPRPGRDPAAQKQTGLAAAAQQPQGNGTRVTKPGRSSTKDHPRDAVPSDVLSNPATSGQLSSGCAVGYGKPGAQCLPAKGPNGTRLTCMYVMNIFPDGVAVTGKDRLNLDANQDGIACGPGDPM